MPYPTSYDDWGISGNPIRSDLTTRLNQIYTAIETLQQTIGLDPAGVFSTLVERIEALEAALADKADNAAVSDTFNALQDAQDPFPNSLYPLLHRQSSSHARDIYVTTTAPATGDDGAIHFDLDG